MSTTDIIHDAEEQFADGDIEGAFRNLVSEVTRLQKENEQLRDRVSDLEDELDSRAKVEWEGPNPAKLTITSTEAGNSVTPYKAIIDRPDYDEFEDLQERVRILEDGQADVVVRGEFDGDELPIERKIAERTAGGDLSANKARATVIFPKFGGFAEMRGGSQLVLSSSDVRTLLAENTDRSDWPNETVKRAMVWTAKLTSRRDSKDEWDPRDEDNLLTLRNGRSGSLELVADKEEFRDFYAQITEEA